MSKPSVVIIYLILLFSYSFINSQTNLNDNTIVNAYNNFSEAPREVVYVHLNKSTYIKGEMLGFNAYVFDKFTKKVSSLTKNLYCTITDKNGKLILSKLIEINNGVADNIFKIDGVFTTGEYTFKAYTNWMLNFDEQNYFVQNFNVLDPENKKEIKPNKASSKLNVQILPEGGHIVASTQNNLGVIVKDNFGYGVSNISGKIIDSKSNTISEFKLNSLGIGKVNLLPNYNESYTLVLIKNYKEYNYPIKDIKPIGIVMSLSSLQDKVVLSIKTNSKTLPIIKNKNYTLAIHNGKNLFSTLITFNENLEINRAINYTDLHSGINIFTLLDDKNNPLLERLFFNFNALSITKSDLTSSVIKQEDSVTIALKFKNINPSKFNNISISVLPNETNSYGHNHNILSYIFLQPYVKGYIENARYYFTDISRKTKYDLDNLLITQGWSSYSWNSIFSSSSIYRYNFETGINVVANLNKTNGGDFLVYPLQNNVSEIFSLQETDKAFVQKSVFPIGDEKFRVGMLKANNKFKTPGLYVQFSPSNIPSLTIKNDILSPKDYLKYENFQIVPFSKLSWEKIEELDEVVVKTKKERTDIDKIRSSSINGKVEIITDRMRMTGITFGAFISGRGFEVEDFQGVFSITNRSPTFFNNPVPIIYLDGVQLVDLSILSNFTMEIVDYIEIDKVGVGMRAGGGVIKIHTDPSIIRRRPQSSKNINVYDFPVTFDSPKKYYVPSYQFYSTKFFREYGVIGWFPNKKTKENNTIDITFFNTRTKNVNLYIEGVANDGSFISEVKTIVLD